VRAAVVAAIAWSAVHAYTGAIFVTVSVFAALIVEHAVRRDWSAVWRRAAVVAAIVMALQIPWLLHQLSSQFRDTGMAAVSWSLTEFRAGHGPRLGASLSAYLAACDFLQAAPWHVAALP